MSSTKAVTGCYVQYQQVTGRNMQYLTVAGNTVQQSVAYINCLRSIAFQIQLLQGETNFSGKPFIAYGKHNESSYAPWGVVWFGHSGLPRRRSCHSTHLDRGSHKSILVTSSRKSSQSIFFRSSLSFSPQQLACAASCAQQAIHSRSPLVEPGSPLHY